MWSRISQSASPPAGYGRGYLSMLTEEWSYRSFEGFRCLRLILSTTLRRMAPPSAVTVLVDGTNNHRYNFLYDRRDPWFGVSELSGRRGGSPRSLRAATSRMIGRDGMAAIVGR
ncbi:hypothetical protein GW17_00060393 [Ensete ventricosum]|nr:hypothetical protein GW17_00060393 [Ensete ventricosum]